MTNNMILIENFLTWSLWWR